MSYKATDWAFEQDLPPLEKAVLLALAHCMNWETGRCDPSAPTMADMTGWSERSVRKALTELARGGWIKQSFRTGQCTSFRLLKGCPMRGAAAKRTPARGSGSPANERVEPLQQVHPNREENREENRERARAREKRVEDDDAPTLLSLVQDEPLQAERQKNKEPDRFEEFWLKYPRRVAKGHARRAWAKAVKSEEPENIISAAERYARGMAGAEARFIKHPATWLNGECWSDEAPAAASGQGAPQSLAQRVLRDAERRRGGASRL